MGITQYQLARGNGVPQRRTGEIVAGARTITTDKRLRFFFGMSEVYGIGLQTDYDAANKKDLLAGTLAKIKPLAPARQPWESPYLVFEPRRSGLNGLARCWP